MTEGPQIYRDSWGLQFDSIDGLARYRVDHPAPQLGATQCPAIEYTFAVSTDDGHSWRNPGENEQQELRQNVRAHLMETGRCCLNNPDNCPVDRQGQ